MHVHPDIAALRSDRASQRSVQTAMDTEHRAWLESACVREIARDLGQFAKGAALKAQPALAALLGNHRAASAFVERFCQHFAAALRYQPLGEVPLRHGTSPGFARLQLLQSGGAVLSLCAYEPASVTHTPETAQFVDCEMHEIVLAGSANGLFATLTSREQGRRVIVSDDVKWAAGDTINRAARTQSRQIIAVERSLLVLQLSRTPSRPAPTCEYDLKTGALVQQASGDKRSSQQVMALCVLGALGHREALAPMEGFARQSGNDPDARWEAVRQTLAMDTARGIELLEGLALASADPLAAPAQKLRDQLAARFSLPLETS